MLEAKARWILSETEEEAAQALAEALNLHPLVARLLAARGILGEEEARRFLHAGAGDFHDPFLLKGMAQAVERITAALAAGEKIRIYGDYDADGISSTTLMDRLMKQLGADYDTYIPHRIHEGYGLNRDAVEQAAKAGVTLIVTVDTGISAKEEIAYAGELGISVVVTDHHEPPQELPQAAAIVNPKQPGCGYPCKELAGVGVAFKLAHALLGAPPLEWLELAAIGTIADLMPLVDENRLIVKLGLEQMRSTSSLGLKALLEVAGIERAALNETHIGYSLAPRINASGRMDHAGLAVRLLITEQEQEARQLALELDALNKERQRIVEEMVKEALYQTEQRGLGDKGVMVVAGEGWNVGVVGIVASKLLERYYRPAIVLSVDPHTGLAKGSARSIPGFDIYKALTSCSHLLDHYGGHQAAAGLTIGADKVRELEEHLNLLAQQWLSGEDWIPVIHADAACSLVDTTLSCIEQIHCLAPFGSGNPSPRFVFEGLRIAEKRTMGKEQQHLKLVLEAAEAEMACSVEAVGFGYGDKADGIASTSRLDVLGELSVNVWNGTRKPQILIQDLRILKPQVFDWRGAKAGRSRRGSLPVFPRDSGILIFTSDVDAVVPREWLESFSLWSADDGGEPRPVNAAAERGAYNGLQNLVLYQLPPYREWLDDALSRLGGLQRIYAVFADGHDAGEGGMPDRDAFKSVYALLAKNGQLPLDDDRIWAAIGKRTGVSPSAGRFILQVFAELGFAIGTNGEYRHVASPPKRDLSDSALYRRRLNRAAMEQLYIYSTADELQELLLAPVAGAVHCVDRQAFNKPLKS